mgnify:CR=1 FL=1
MTPEELALDGEITPQFLSRAEEELFAEASLGVEAIRFLNSDLGRVLRGYALQEIEEAKDAILTVSPWNPFGRRKIQKLQHQAAVASQFLLFIKEALMRGQMAEMSLKSLRD